jgi:hypothetical protein
MVIHYTPGDYLTQTAASWVQLASGNVNLTSGKATGYLPVSVTIPAGATYGFFVGLTTGTVQYTNGIGTHGVTPWFTNGDFIITEGKGGPFPNPVNVPRNWNGKVYYGFVGCSEIRKEVTFVVSPDTAKAVIASAVETIPGQFTFNSNGSNGHVYQWTFGNGVTASGANTTTTYTSGGAFTVSLVVVDTVCGTSDSTFTVVNSTVGLNEFAIDQTVRAYPNPNNGQFVLTFEGGALNGKTNVLNAVGQTVATFEFQKDAGVFNQALDLRSLPKGIYHVQVMTNQGSIVLRMVLQ